MSAPAWLVAQPIAHRGLHDKTRGVIENTVAAADAAIAAGYAIECDVQQTADGDAVVFHDFELDRLTGETGPVRSRRAADLAAIAIAGSASDRIPTLTSFLGHIGGRVPLIVEIKSRFDGDPSLAKRVCAVVAGYAGPIALKSFDPAVIAALRALAPEIVRGIVAENRYDDPAYAQMRPERKHALANLLHFEESQPHFLSWSIKDLPSAAPHLCRLLGRLPVMTWTVRTQEDRERAQRYADQMVFEGFRP